MKIRNLKPSFWKHSMHKRISTECALVAVAMLNYADDEGRFLIEPDVMQGDMFPLRKDMNIAQHIEELAKPENGWLQLYEALVDNEKRRYGLIKNFKKHQWINKPTPSNYPPPPREGHETDPVPEPIVEWRSGAFIDVWNKSAKRWKLARVPERNDPRIEEMVKTCKIQDWIAAVAKIDNSDFLQGKAKEDQGWKVTFAWLIDPINMEKVMSGNYDGRSMRNKNTRTFVTARDIVSYQAECDNCHKTYKHNLDSTNGEEFSQKCDCGKRITFHMIEQELEDATA